jgi:[protein-PII] uridylyltransferase
VDDLWNSLPLSVFLRFSNDQLAWAATEVLSAPVAKPVVVAVRELKQQGISELLVHAPDYDGLFSAVTVVIDEIGLDVLSARVITTISGKSFDLFELMDSHGQALNTIDSNRLQARLSEVLGACSVPAPIVRKLPRRLRPFQTSTQIRFSAARGGDMTLMDVMCADQPGLLSQISSAMVTCGIRIHDARIVTMGDRVEDAFIISDQHDAPLSRELRTELKQALIEILER